MDLLSTLIVISEKAANIARVCRKDEHLFELLVQKKKPHEANPRFVEDFKTLADVLIQEMVKHDIKKQFPELCGNIKGEENNIFQNTLGEKIHVEVKSTIEETSSLLDKVLNGDKEAADLLAAEVHRKIQMESVKTKRPMENFEVDVGEMGIWIDPIDCTAEYIHGGSGDVERGIHHNGLKCVTILIGVFNKVTGVPVMGVINRPFLNETDLESTSNCIWGVSLPNFLSTCVPKRWECKNIICISSSEDKTVKQKLETSGFDLIPTSGAGYKMLNVILGLADAYILTKGTTFKWDTCASHSILKTLGGDVIAYDAAFTPIRYAIDGNNRNLSGIMAYRNEDVLRRIQSALF